MRLAVVLPLIATCALSACGGGGAPEADGNKMSNALLDPAKEMARRWSTVFADPAVRARAASDMGYKIGALQPAEGGFAAKSDVQIVQLPKSPVKIATTMEASGANATLVDRYVFRFDAHGDDGNDTKAASDVDKTPLRVTMGFLQRFEVAPDDEIKVAFKELKLIHKALPGATIDFAPEAPADPKRPRNRKSVVTITRPGVATPAPTPSPSRK